MATISDAQDLRQPNLTYSREQFDDYLVALLARIRFNDNADRLLSGESHHPLLLYQRQHAEAIGQLKILPFSASQLIEDPIGCYVQFTRSLAEALNVFPGFLVSTPTPCAQPNPPYTYRQDTWVSDRRLHCALTVQIPGRALLPSA